MKTSRRSLLQGALGLLGLGGAAKSAAALPSAPVAPDLVLPDDPRHARMTYFHRFGARGYEVEPVLEVSDCGREWRPGPRLPWPEPSEEGADGWRYWAENSGAKST